MMGTKKFSLLMINDMLSSSRPYPQVSSAAARYIIIFLAVAALILPIGGLAEDATTSCPLRITFVDVGEGDSTIIEPLGEAPLVVDTGSPLGATKVLEHLKRSNHRQLSGIALTHPHLDHIGGLFTLRASFPTTVLFHNSQPLRKLKEEQDIYRWYQEALDTNKETRPLRRGDAIKVGAAKIQALWPPPGELDDDWNKNSLVLKVTFGSFSLILMGDALISSEQELIKTGADLSATILKVGHHGSKFATGEKFLAAVNPKLSVVSVNAGNVRGYPDAATIQRLVRHGELLRTDQHGSIEICAESSGRFKVNAPKL